MYIIYIYIIFHYFFNLRLRCLFLLYNKNNNKSIIFIFISHYIEYSFKNFNVNILNTTHLREKILNIEAS